MAEDEAGVALIRVDSDQVVSLTTEDSARATEVAVADGISVPKAP